MNRTKIIDWTAHDRGGIEAAAGRNEMRHCRLRVFATTLLAIASIGCSTDPLAVDEPDPMPEPEPEPDPEGVPGTWGSSQLLHDLPGSSGTPILRVDASGQALAIWEQSHPVAPYSRLWASQRIGGTWQAPTLIANDSNVSSEARVIGDTSNVDAAWKRSMNGTWEIVGTRARAGAWEPLSVLRASTWQQGYLTDPRLAATSTHTTIIWAAEDPVSRRFAIEGRIRTSTGGWSLIPAAASGVPLATYAGPLYDVGYDADGALVVTWVEQQTDRVEIWARRGLPADGSLSVAWDAAVKLATLPTQQGSQVVRQLWTGAHAGRAFAAWLSAEADGSLAVAASHRRPDGTWDAEQTTRNIKSSHYAAPRFAAGADGHKVVLWREPAQDSSRVLARTFDPDSGWSDDQVVAGDLKPPYLGCIDIDAHYFDVAIDGQGNAIALWEERLDEKVEWRSAMGIWSSQLLAGAGWQAPVRIDAGGRVASIPVAALANGTFGGAAFTSQGSDGRALLETNTLVPAR